MLGALGDAFGTVLGAIGSFVNAMTSTGGSLHEVLPLFAIGIAVSLLYAAIRGVRKMTWGA